MRRLRLLMIAFCMISILSLVGCKKDIKKEVEYTIEIEANGGTINSTKSTIKEGETYILPSITRAGYTFLGWYYDEGLTEKCSSSFVVDKDYKLYASWEARPQSLWSLKELYNSYKETLVTFSEYRGATSNIIYSSNYGDVDNVMSYMGISSEMFAGALFDSSMLYAFQLKNSTVSNLSISGINYNLQNPDTFVIDAYGFGEFLQNRIKEIDNVVYDTKVETLLLCKKSLTESIKIPETVEKMALWAFSGSNVKEVDMSSSKITIISDYSFSNCSKLEKIIFPDNLQTIGTYSFNQCKVLKNITFPRTLKEIKNGAFYYCISLENVDLPSNLTSLGGSCFSNCIGLKQCVFEAGIKLENVGNNIFEKCILLEEIVGLENLDTIYEGMFYNCVSLTKIILPSSITTIRKNAFGDCSKISEIKFSKELKTIEETSLIGLTSLTKIIVDTNNPNYIVLDNSLYTKDQKTLVLYVNGNGQKSFTMPNSVTNIYEGVFYKNTYLTSITLSNNLESISKACFGNCINLTNIDIPNSISSIKESAFSGCTSLKEITIHTSSRIETFGDRAFSNCASLEKITIPSTTKIIGKYVFNECTSLSDVTFGYNCNITIIDEYAFYSCSALKEVNFPLALPAGLQELKIGCFAYCTSLEYLIIRSGITNVEAGAFAGSSLMSIYMTLPRNAIEEELKFPSNWNSGLPTYYNGEWKTVNDIPVPIITE